MQACMADLSLSIMNTYCSHSEVDSLPIVASVVESRQLLSGKFGTVSLIAHCSQSRPSVVVLLLLPVYDALAVCDSQTDRIVQASKFS